MAVAPALEDGTLGGCGSQFFVTLADNIDYLDGKHAVFGHVVEGLDTLEKLNEVFVDQEVAECVGLERFGEFGKVDFL